MSPPPHVLLFPFHTPGHLIPLLDLAGHLCRRGVSVTVVATPATLPLIPHHYSRHHLFQTLLLSVDDYPPPATVAAAIAATLELHDPIVEWFRNQPSPPSAIISDMFLGWTHRLAASLCIPHIVFSPSGAFGLSVMYCLWRDMPRRNDKNDVVSFPTLTNLPKYPWCQVSPLYRSYVESDPASEIVKEGFRANMTSWGLVVNSFLEFERVYVDSLQTLLGHDRVWAVGPLLPHEVTERGGPTQSSVEELQSWLDKCEASVVYVCFGSQITLTENQAAVIASGLEKSGAHFIWPVGPRGTVPSGFEDRVCGRGRVLRGWAPQVMILSHRVVTVFVTHCGWNSVLEAVVAGVAMLTWPMGADQFVNADLVVDEMKVAIRVCEGSDSVPDSDEFARVVTESVSENNELRERVRKLRDAAIGCIKDGGSSKKDLDELVKKLAELEPQVIL